MQLLIIKNYKTVVNFDSTIEKAIGSENMAVAQVAAQKIMRNKKFRRRAIILVGMVLFITLSPHGAAFASAVSGPENIGRLGNRFWSFVKVIAKWTCIISGGLDVLRNLNAGDVKGIWKVALKYVVAYCVIVGLPWAFDEVDKFFV